MALEPQLKLLVSSANPESSLFARFREYGFGERLLKPYSLTELGQALANLLEPVRA